MSLAHYYAAAKAYLTDCQRQTGHFPSETAFRRFALEWLASSEGKGAS